MELPLTQPAVDGQCMLAPKVEARLLQELVLKPTDKVLDIGSGSGHLAALIAHLAQRVVSLEIEPALARQARDNLQKAGVINAEVRQADAAADQFAACRADAPFDAIVLGGSVAEVPPALLDLLAPGGRLVAIVGDEPVMRATVITRTGDASFHTAQPWDTVAPRLLHFPQPSRFRF
jgi:protein-L-isoaspartate(D-aspartate) O-methyltransferase